MCVWGRSGGALSVWVWGCEDVGVGVGIGVGVGVGGCVCRYFVVPCLCGVCVSTAHDCVIK